MFDETMTFSTRDSNDAALRHALLHAAKALREKGYTPTSQLIGYILSNDPTYITTHNDARRLLCHFDRDEILRVLVENFLTEKAEK